MVPRLERRRAVPDWTIQSAHSSHSKAPLTVLAGGTSGSREESKQRKSSSSAGSQQAGPVPDCWIRSQQRRVTRPSSFPSSPSDHHHHDHQQHTPAITDSTICREPPLPPSTPHRIPSPSLLLFFLLLVILCTLLPHLTHPARVPTAPHHAKPPRAQRRRPPPPSSSPPPRSLTSKTTSTCERWPTCPLISDPFALLPRAHHRCNVADLVA